MNVEVHFHNIENVICSTIDSSRADKILICTGWISSRKILEKASTIDAMLITNACGRLTKGCSDYDPTFTRYLLDCIPHTYVYSNNTELMHHKTIVLFQSDIPFAVITGSFNFTLSASKNHENICIIRDRNVAQQFVDEFCRLLKHPCVKKLVR